LEIWQLHPREREISLSPVLAPVFDEQRKLLSVELAALDGKSVRLALVPNRAFDCVADERCDFSVEKVSGSP
jgi:hypothetical protein